MYEKHDAYLLYEYMKKVSFTVRILVRVKEKVDAKLLKEAAQKAISRLPYFAVKIRVDKGSNFVLEHNDAPIPVLPEKEERLMLGSEAVSGHLFAITYKDNCVYGVRGNRRHDLAEEHHVSVSDGKIRRDSCPEGYQASGDSSDGGRDLLSGSGKAAG